MCVWGVVFSCVWPFVTQWTCQVLLSMNFFRQEYWSGFPFPTPGDHPEPGMKLTSHVSSALAGRFFTIAPLGFLEFQSVSLVSQCPTLWSNGLQQVRLPCRSPTSDIAQIYVHQVSNVIRPSQPLSSPSPPYFNLSQHHGLFQWVSSSHHVAKFWSFSFNISSSNEYSGLIPFRMDWLDLLAVQVTLKSVLQHHSSKASIL